MSDLFVDNIKHQSSQGSGTITLGTSGETIALASGASVTGNGLVGITMADQWRLTADTNDGTNADVTTNWERNDDTGWSGIGTGLTESSGIFSFPQTGIYLLMCSFNFGVAAGDGSLEVAVNTTTDNSTYSNASRLRAGNRGSTSAFLNSSNNILFDVTNITTHKFKFTTGSFSSGTHIQAETTAQESGFAVIRIGDT